MPRKVGGAVVRNRLKRQLREAMAALGPDAARGSDVVVVARAGLDEAVETQGFAWLVEELRALVLGAGRRGVIRVLLGHVPLRAAARCGPAAHRPACATAASTPPVPRTLRRRCATHGPIRGTGLAIWRVLRCNPWNPGGHDPVRPR